MRIILLSFVLGICVSSVPHHGIAQRDSSRPSLATLDKQIFTQNTVIEADRIEIQSGARIRVRNGAALKLKADTIVIFGPAFIDGRGEPGHQGAPGQSKNDTWRSSGGGGWYSCDIAHRDWVASGSEVDRGGDGGPGGPGGPGAIIILEYRDLQGPANLQTEFRGGPGGPGGPGGTGRILCCGCHNNECKRGPSGRSGPNGQPGPNGREVRRSLTRTQSIDSTSITPPPERMESCYPNPCPSGICCENQGRIWCCSEGQYCTYSPDGCKYRK